MVNARCIKKIRNNSGAIQSYVLEDSKGNIRQLESNLLKKIIKDGTLITVENLRLTTDNKLIDKYIKQPEEEISKEQLTKVDKLRLYEAKQKLTGDIFEFYTNSSGEIFIQRYYDIPERKEVAIPDFVDGITGYGDTRGQFGAFSECRYIEKIIMHSNVKYGLNQLFKQFKGKRLDLSDFNTSNITDMCGMFVECKAKEIVFGEKFNTSKVERMINMFLFCEVQSLDLSYFDTSKVTVMTHMFSECRAETINLGNNFDTSNVIDMSYMFGSCNLKEINLGNKFNTSNVLQMNEMFISVKSDKISLGDKFDTSQVKTMHRMFYQCMLNNELDLGHNFNIKKNANTDKMFTMFKAKKLIIHCDKRCREVEIIQNELQRMKLVVK